MGKLIVVVLDGMGDLPTPILKGKTPLEDAETPNMDYFTEKGALGLLKIFKIDHEDFIRANGSNFGYITLMGSDPRQTSWKRGPIEAIGGGMDFKKGDLAVRFNFGYCDERGIVVDRRAGRISNEEAEKYIEEIKEKLSYSKDYEIKSLLSHRGGLIIKSNQKLGEEITESDPLKEGYRIGIPKPLNNKEENIRSANLLRVFEEQVDKILKNTKLNQGRLTKGGYPVNCILTRGAGTDIPELPDHSDFAAIATSPVEKGICKISNMKLLGLEQPTDKAEDDINETLEILKKNYDNHNKLFIIIKAPDTAGHDGQSMKKKEIFEMIDKTIFNFLKEKINLNQDILCVTADHATPVIMKRHYPEPIPLMITGKIKPDESNKFSEKQCQEGSLGTMWGYDLMKTLHKFYRD